MFPSNNAAANTVINEFVGMIKETLGENLTGVYLTGSLVWGDFDEKTSDIDLVVVLSSDVNDLEFKALSEMHEALITKFADWNNRIDVVYVSQKVLNQETPNQNYLIKISSDEPLNKREYKSDWLMNWYLIREKGLALFGSEAKTIVKPISKKEFIDIVKTHAKNWVEYVKETEHSRASQAYTVLTLCRALYTINNEEQVSKSGQ